MRRRDAAFALLSLAAAPRVIELLLELVPRPTRIAYLGRREEGERPYVVKMRAVAERLGARALGIAILHSLLLRADRGIE